MARRFRHDRQLFIIDDDPAIRHSLGFFVRTLSIDLVVEAFASGTEFIEYLDTHEVSSPACLIVDARMPKLSGTGLMKALVARGKRFAFIMISGDGGDSLRQQAEELGAIEFLNKPFAPSQLRDAIERAFDQ